MLLISDKKCTEFDKGRWKPDCQMWTKGGGMGFHLVWFVQKYGQGREGKGREGGAQIPLNQSA
jgi:hypothetical protein